MKLDPDLELGTGVRYAIAYILPEATYSSTLEGILCSDGVTLV
jgi:hypothetical protein